MVAAFLFVFFFLSRVDIFEKNISFYAYLIIIVYIFIYFYSAVADLKTALFSFPKIVMNEIFSFVAN